MAPGKGILSTEFSPTVLLHCTLSLVAQCIVIGPVCGRVCNGQAACVCVFEGLLPR